MSAERQVEVLDVHQGVPFVEAAWRRVRGNPLVLGPLVVVLLVGAGIALTWAVRGPDLPTLAVTAGAASGSSPAPWSPAGDGRPDGPVVVREVVSISRVDAGRGPATVLGIAGPGVVSTANPAYPLAAGNAAVSAELVARVDCTRLPPSIPARAYGLRVRVGPASGSDGRTGVVDAGGAAGGWRSRIEMACASWAARRDLTVTAVAARIDPVLPHADLTLTVTNTGAHEGTVSVEDPTGRVTVTGPLPLTVPPSSSATATIAVTLNTCDAVAYLLDGQDPAARPGPTTVLHLVGLAGPHPAVPVRPDALGEGYGPTTLLLSRGAATDLTAALSHACGDLRLSVAFIGPGTSRFDAATRTLSLPITVDVPPGQVSGVRLTPRANTAPAGYEPLWTSTPELVPDRNGQVRTTLRYRAPPSERCAHEGALLPFAATVRVPVPGGERVLTYSPYITLGSDPPTLALICGSP